jgi:hypothetical protein
MATLATLIIGLHTVALDLETLGSITGPVVSVAILETITIIIYAAFNR